MRGNNEFLNVQELKSGMIITKDIVKSSQYIKELLLNKTYI